MAHPTDPPGPRPAAFDAPPDVPHPGWRAFLAFLGRAPQAGLSRALGRLADVPIPAPARRPVLGGLARTLGIDLSEAARPVEAYGSINELFVRRLRGGVRSWPDDPDVATSPVDGIAGLAERIHGGRAIQAKGRHYAVADLLEDPEEAARYEGGMAVTLYLSPRHYHRIHAPLTGSLDRAHHVPGALWPVNQPAIAHIDDVFPRNERLICYLEGAVGRMAVVAVGAYNVGRISAAFDSAWAGDDGTAWITNRRDRPPRERRYDPPLPVERGDELMAFHLGSTVVLLFEGDAVELDPAFAPGAEIRLGQPLARPPGPRELEGT